jgi:exodeoxyribonuclease-5
MNNIDTNLLVLPKITQKMVTEKLKVITSPNIETLNELQLEIYNKITNINAYSFSQTLLTGYSGTGKSFLVTKIIEGLIANDRNLVVGITAPTNKAVRVLKNLSSIDENHRQVGFNTLHSLLGLKRVITNEGKEEYKADFNSSDISEYNIIIVDEVSMLDNEIYNTLILSAKRNKIMLLFIGDRGQIPPVNGGESVLFSIDLENNFNLSDIIRQAKGNPIVDLAQKIRSNESYVLETTVDEKNNGIIVVKLNTEMPLLEHYFKSDNFNSDPNFIKVLAWTNSAVNYYNGKIRAMIYGEGAGKICVGEKMICNKPIIDSKKRVLLNNNDEFEVISFSMKEENRKYTFSYYSIAVMSNGVRHVIKVLAEKSEASFQKELLKLKTKANNSSAMSKRNAWSAYFKLLDRYADIKYNYALTVHKSQGSTFDNVIVINCDIKRVRNNTERGQLLYTAVTRAKDKLFII